MSMIISLGWLLIAFLWLPALVIFSALWVRKDAKKFREKGVDINPGIWSDLVFVFWIIAFPWYLILKFSRYKRAAELGNPPLPPVSKIYDWLLLIISLVVSVLITLILMLSALMGAKKISNETKVNKMRTEWVNSVEEAKRKVIFEYIGSVASYNLIHGAANGITAGLVLDDYFKKNPPFLFILTQETKAYKMVNGNKVKINISDLKNIKKGAMVSVKSHEDKDNNKMIEEIILKRWYQ